MEKIKITASYDCLITSKEQQLFVKEGQSVYCKDNEILSIYPTGKTKQKVSFCLDTSHATDTQFFKVATLNEKKVFFLTNGQICESRQISILKIDQQPCKIEIGKNLIEIEYGHNKKIVSLSESYNKYNVGVLSTNAYILLTNENKQELLFYSTKNNEVEAIEGDEIKISSNLITLTKNLENIARHIIQQEYLATEEGLIKKDSHIDYHNGRPIICTVPQTVPYAFLQAMEVGDLQLASSYLDLPLRRRIDQQHLQQYFGQIQQFFHIEKEKYLVLSLNEKQIYNFCLNDNKISEIEKI